MPARRPLGVVVATAVVGAGTAATRLAAVPLSALAASPRSIGEGRWWLLVTSCLLADTPWLPSLIGFAIVLSVALYVLTVRDVALSAVVGQICSALIVYGAIGVVRLHDPHALGSAFDSEDYGVSAIIAAWIGAVARIAWTRFPGRRGHLGVAAGCLVCLGVGLAFRPTITFLDSEHVVAFVLGAAVARSSLRRVVPRPPAAATSG